MSPTNAELQAAFNRTGLQRGGTSFNQAIACDMLKKCLVRIAINAQNKASSAPAQAYWWQAL